MTYSNWKSNGEMKEGCTRSHQGQWKTVPCENKVAKPLCQIFPFGFDCCEAIPAPKCKLCIIIFLCLFLKI